MKKIIITIALLLSLTTVKAQYYVVPADSVASWLPLMEQSLGNPNIAARYDTAGTQAVMKFTIALAPTGSGNRYTVSEIRTILSGAAWNPFEPTPPIESDERIELAREYGAKITNTLFAKIDSLQYIGDITATQGGAVIQNYGTLWGLIDEGLFRIAYLLINSGAIAPQGVITQGFLDSIKAKLLSWETNHPRP